MCVRFAAIREFESCSPSPPVRLIQGSPVAGKKAPQFRDFANGPCRRKLKIRDFRPFGALTALQSAARAHCESYGENYLAAEMDRLEALLLQRAGAPTELIEQCLAKALDTARQKATRLFELRSATALARIIAEHNEHKAVDIPAPIYNWFTEGLDTADLKEAKALLDQLT